LLEGLCANERTGNVTGIFVDAAGDFACWFLRTASHLERATVTIELARPVQQLLDIHDAASGGERLPAGHV
jgi:hypothetical protein